MSPADALRRAAKAATTQAELARRVSEIVGESVTQSHIATWIHRGKCPPNRAVAVSQAVDGVVRPQDLCPDVFPADFEASAA